MRYRSFLTFKARKTVEDARAVKDHCWSQETTSAATTRPLRPEGLAGFPPPSALGAELARVSESPNLPAPSGVPIQGSAVGGPGNSGHAATHRVSPENLDE